MQHLTQSAINAHNWTSFTPERRGKQFIAEVSTDLQNDLEELKKFGADAEELQQYSAKFEQIVRAWIAAKSNCASSYITGGSGFNVRRAEKANNREHAHSTNYYQFRNKVIASCRKRLEAEKKQSRIDEAGGEAALMRKQVEDAKAYHEQMKLTNAMIRKAGKDPVKLAVLLNISQGEAEKLLQPDFCGRIGVPQYMLTNNLANIKRMEQRVKELEAKEARKEEGGQTIAQKGNGWELIVNNDADRLQFVFDGKPKDEIREMLKKNGYKWAPSQSAWQRQITSNAIFATRHLLPKLKELSAA